MAALGGSSLIRPRLFALLACLSLAAGCLGGEEESATPADATVTTPTTPAGTEPLANTTTEPAAPLAPVAVDVSYAGETGTWACAFVVGQPPACQGSFSTTSAKELPAEAAPLRLTGALYWNATVPAGQGLRVSVFPVGDPFNATALAVTGTTSPLAFDFDLAGFEGVSLGMDVSSVTGTGLPDGSFVGGSYATPFQVVASFVYQPAA